MTARTRTPTGTPTAAPIVAVLVPPEPAFSVLRAGAGLGLDAEEDIEDDIEVLEVGAGLGLDAEEDIENVVEARIVEEDEANVRGVWAEKDPSAST